MMYWTREFVWFITKHSVLWKSRCWTLFWIKQIIVLGYVFREIENISDWTSLNTTAIHSVPILARRIPRIYVGMWGKLAAACNTFASDWSLCSIMRDADVSSCTSFFGRNRRYHNTSIDRKDNHSPVLLFRVSYAIRSLRMVHYWAFWDAVPTVVVVWLGTKRGTMIVNEEGWNRIGVFWCVLCH